ncbi:hypothetical protein VTN31DRAFT_5914 [Thermomyces dupontii]|uniref:uncharacterized protein n=1 Tax=Talaromyces thermophilus TaxID=28565 RepID=UPI003743E926
MTDALSIEQNNKIRAALGLKPLPVPGADNDASDSAPRESRDSTPSDNDPGSTLESREAEGHDNWKKFRAQAEERRKREERMAAIKKARDMARRHAKLEGKSLGELGDDMDTKTWLAQHKKLQKKVEKERARKLAEELAERDRVVEHTAADLAGVKVAHDIADFETGEGQILTLKDATIDELEAEGDELENIELREKEKLQERLELKKKKAPYDPTEANESGTILSQYDEEIEGKKRKHFTLDAQGSTAEEREAKRQHVADMLKKQAISLDIAPSAPVSDYMDISEVKVKKPKKKKAKSTRQKALDDDEIIIPAADAADTPNGASHDASNGDAMQVDGEPGVPRQRKSETTSFVDDDDLQASLALQRRAAFKKRKKMRPEDIARQLREESQTPMEVENGEEEAPGLVIDETSEFISTIQKPTISERPSRRATTPAEDRPIKEESPEEKAEDVDMDRSYHEAEDEEEKASIKEEEEKLEVPAISGTGLDEEKTLDEGLGATVAMLRQRGLVQQSDAAELNRLHRERERFIREKQRLEEEAERRARLQRERDRATGKLDRMSAREREEYSRRENKQREQQESKLIAEMFEREYKPDIQLKYVDEHGRLMNQKEAFKHLSHQFHGKGSGKMKTEKHLKKIEEEKKREAMSALDSSQHTTMNSAMGATAKRNRQAGVRLA